MTTTALPLAAGLDPGKAEHGGWETRGEFDCELAEGGWIVFHTTTDTFLDYTADPGQFRAYVDSGMALAEYQRRSEERAAA